MTLGKVEIATIVVVIKIMGEAVIVTPLLGFDLSILGFIVEQLLSGAIAIGFSSIEILVILRPGLIEGECVENILHNGRCCADVTAQMRRSVLTIPLGSPRSPFSISPQC